MNTPKPDGYRCLHIVFKTKNLRNSKHNNLNIELQVRTELQHQWATAVEIIGLYKGVSYKSGLGDEDTREFLCICSNLFAIQEGTPIDPRYYDKNLYEELKKLNEKLNIIDYLKGLTVIIDKNNIKKGENASSLCLILLKLDEKRVSLKTFKTDDEAKNEYAKQEKFIAHRKLNWDTVLVSIDNIEGLKKAYPNYYLDSKKFISICENYIRKA